MMEKKINTICIAGKNTIAVNALKHLIKNYSHLKILYIPNPTDNGKDNWQPSLIKYSNSKKIQRTSLDEISEIENLLFISLEFSELINPKKFNSKNLYNIHFSKLPKYKGMYTSALPILHDERQTGVTLHQIDSGIDTGPIIDQKTILIRESDTAKDIYLKYLHIGEKIFKKNIERLVAGNTHPTPQPPQGSSYFSKSAINYKKLKIDLKKTANEIHNQFRAYTFREYQMPTFNDWQILKTKILEKRSLIPPGRIIKETEHSFEITTIDHNILLIKDYYPKLWQACKTGNLKHFNQALLHIENINERTPEGKTALDIALQYKNIKLTKLLLDRGAKALNRPGTGRHL